MERKEAFEIVASWIKTCHDLAENDRYEAMDDPGERDMYMRSAKAWEEREEAFGIILGLARGYEYHESKQESPNGKSFKVARIYLELLQWQLFFIVAGRKIS